MAVEKGVWIDAVGRFAAACTGEYIPAQPLKHSIYLA